MIIMKTLFLVASLLLPFNSFANSEAKPVNEPVYFQIKPNILVNLTGKARYLTMEVQLYLKDAAAEESVKKHLPMLRHDIVMAFSGQNRDTLDQLSVRAKLKEIVMAFAKKIELHDDQVMDVLVTNMLMR